MPTSGSYLSRVKDLAAKENVTWPDEHRPASPTRALYKDTAESKTTTINAPHLLLSQYASNTEAESVRSAICVVENITPDWIEELGSAWHLDPSFFVRHAISHHPASEDAWRVRLQHIWEKPETAEPYQFYNMTGTLTKHERSKGMRKYLPIHFPRPVFERDDGSVQWSTRISYYRVYSDLYLFLIDPPLLVNTDRPFPLQRRKRTTLRLPYAVNAGGIVMPRLFAADEYRLWDSFEMFLLHDWHFRILFFQSTSSPATPVHHAATTTALPIAPLLYMLSNCIGETNLRFLRELLYEISFVEIRRPTQAINDRLHDLREDLADLKARVSEVSTHIPKGVADYLEEFPVVRNRHLLIYLSPVDNHQRIVEEVSKLESFLMETFQLLMSSLSVKDSQISIEQSRRGTLVTWLAFIYVPLSFVTGIFGMNIKEVNGSPLSVSVCFVALGVVLLVTALGFALYQLLRRKQTRSALWAYVRATTFASMRGASARRAVAYERMKRRYGGEE